MAGERAVCTLCEGEMSNETLLAPRVPISGDRRPRRLPCGHAFHASCYDERAERWKGGEDPTCPTCGARDTDWQHTVAPHRQSQLTVTGGPGRLVERDKGWDAITSEMFPPPSATEGSPTAPSKGGAQGAIENEGVRMRGPSGEGKPADPDFQEAMRRQFSQSRTLAESSSRPS